MVVTAVVISAAVISSAMVPPAAMSPATVSSASAVSPATSAVPPPPPPPLATAAGLVTIQAARAKARTVMGNLAPRRIGENIFVLLIYVCGTESGRKVSRRRPYRDSRPPDILIYAL